MPESNIGQKEKRTQNNYMGKQQLIIDGLKIDDVTSNSNKNICKNKINDNISTRVRKEY